MLEKFKLCVVGVGKQSDLSKFLTAPMTRLTYMLSECNKKACKLLLK